VFTGMNLAVPKSSQTVLTEFRRGAQWLWVV
jgi:hypothetical protein